VDDDMVDMFTSASFEGIYEGREKEDKRRIIEK
jgi:hypothetical protein